MIKKLIKKEYKWRKCLKLKHQKYSSTDKKKTSEPSGQPHYTAIYSYVGTGNLVNHTWETGNQHTHEIDEILKEFSKNVHAVSVCNNMAINKAGSYVTYLNLVET